MKKINKKLTLATAVLLITTVQGCTTMDAAIQGMSNAVNTGWNSIGTTGQGAVIFGTAATIGCGVTMGREAAVLCGMGASVLGALIGNEIEKTQADYASKHAFLDSRIKITNELIDNEDEKRKKLAKFTKNTKKTIKLLKKKIDRTGEGKKDLIELQKLAKAVYKKHIEEYEISVKHVKSVKKILKDKGYANEKNRNQLKRKLRKLEKMSASYKSETEELLKALG